MDAFLDTVLEKNNFFGLKSVFYRNLLARIAVYFCFVLEGIYMGVWGTYLPNIQDAIGLSDSLLGTAVLFVYFGTVIVSPLVALLLRNFGSRTTTTIGAWAFIGSLPLIALANCFGLLAFFMFNFGFSMGIMDISMNNSAILTEIVASKPLLGSFHGSYSVAAALGSLLGGVFMSANIDTLSAFFIVCGAALTISLMTFWNMYNYEQEKFLTGYHEEDRKDLLKSLLSSDVNEEGKEEEDQRRTIEDDRGTLIKSYQGVLVLDQNRGTVVAYGAGAEGETFTETSRLTTSEIIRPSSLFPSEESNLEANIPSPLHKVSLSSTDENTSSALLDPATDGFSFEALYKSRKIITYFCLVGFLAAWGESGIVTWSVVYFDRYIPAASVIESLGLTSFMICMAIGRFLCDHLRHYFGRRWIIRMGGLLAMSGLIIVVLAPELPIPVFFACLGFALTGLGLSTIIPIVFSSAGHLPGVHAGTALSVVAACSYSGSIVSSPSIGLLSDGMDSLRTALLIDGLLLGLIFPLSWGILEEIQVFKTSNRD